MWFIVPFFYQVYLTLLKLLVSPADTRSPSGSPMKQQQTKPTDVKTVLDLLQNYLKCIDLGQVRLLLFIYIIILPYVIEHAECYKGEGLVSISSFCEDHLCQTSDWRTNMLLVLGETRHALCHTSINMQYVFFVLQTASCQDTVEIIKIFSRVEESRHHWLWCHQVITARGVVLGGSVGGVFVAHCCSGHDHYYEL